MKKSLLLVMAVMLVTLTGCDFLRSLAGRPTSKDVEDKRITILKAEEEALQKRIDSLKLAVDSLILADGQTAADTLEILDSLKLSGVMVSGPEKLRGVAGMGLDYKYYIIIGVFRENANARRIFNAASAKGYAPVLINCRSGLLAVGAAPTNDRETAGKSYLKLQKESFCPNEAWILVNE